MNIKDFKVGQRVCILTYLRNEGYRKTVEIVTKVGRKYIYTAPETYPTFETPYEKSYCKNGLVEARDWGEPNLLFATEKDADEHLEEKELKRWFRTANYNHYTLQLLRAAKNILEPEKKEV